MIWVIVGGVLLLLAVLSVFDIMKDPFYHRSWVNFWVWCKREIVERTSYQRE